MNAAPTMPETYFDLVKRFPLVPIRDEGHLDAATEVLHELIARDLDDGERAYVDVLTEIVGVYEAEHYPPDDVPPGEVLKELLLQNSISQHELAKITGIAQSTLSAICQGSRKPTLEQAKILGDHFKLKPAAFLELS
jgi:HTH-type transcriptional regulator/antitoxin HigA